VSVLTLRDYGRTWDEPETYDTAFLNLRIVKAIATGQARPPWGLHELPGYYFVLDLLRGAFTKVISLRLHLMDDVVSVHFFHVLLSTLSVFLLYRLAHRVSGRRRIAVLSTLVFVLLPQFVAHSQNNPKDLPALFAIVLAVYTFTRLETASGWRDILYAGLALGLALTTHVSAVLLLVVFGLWHVMAGRMLRARVYAALLAIAAVAAFASWPWLWSAPAKNLAWAIKHVAARLHNDYVHVLYLGRIYNAWELPWHYSAVIFLATTPVAYLLLAAASVARLRSPERGPAPSPWSAAILGWLWCGTFVAAELRAPLRYDGVRHLLMVLPAFCLLAGLGLDAILAALERLPALGRSTARRRLAAAAVLGVVFAPVAVALARVHPYHNAYLNEVTNAWLPGHAEDVFEVEYWEQSYKEGAEWLNAHAEPDAVVYVAFGQKCADPYLERPSRDLSEETLPLFEDRTRPAYAMIMTRKAMYRAPMEHIVRAYAPIFTIGRQKGVLLRIYSNRRRAPGGRTPAAAATLLARPASREATGRPLTARSAGP
jgi:Dolichyl-phosphate-mannose-protein mannosyltransferase